MRRQLLFGMAAMAALVISLPRVVSACEECQLRKHGTFLGQFTLLGNGTVRTWLKMDKGKPTSMGITLSENALEGLPETGMGPKTMPSVEHILTLPKEAQITGFDHINLGWNPKGHVPKGVYDTPHFDVHFYMTSPANLAKITAIGADAARCLKQPAAKFMPAGYVLPPETQVPRMGAHAIDGSSPELHGQPFTQTFLYGFYDAKMIFAEPMVTRAFLQSGTDFTTPLKLPKAYAKRGYYPTRYSIKHDTARHEIIIALEGLTYRGGVTPQRVAKK